MGKLRIEGLDDLEKQLKENVKLEDVKKVVRHNGMQLQRKIQKNADFSQGYQTGTTKRSVDLWIRDGGLTADSGPTTEYAQYLEYGTRFMDAQPFVKPAFEEQEKQFESDLKKLVR